MNPNKFVAIYARVSTSRQEEEETINNQINVLEEFAIEKGYIIVNRYLDDGWSGDTIVRPELDNLRTDAKKKKWDAILIYDPDRLARRYSYQELIMDELKEAGIEIIFKTIEAPKNPEDKILHGVRGLFAEYERVKITERFRLGKLRKLKEGHILTSEALYGYRYIPKSDAVHGYYEINETEAEVVRMIFSWIGNDGFTMRDVIKALQGLGIKPRRSIRGVWNTSTLTTMLRHRAYIGYAHWGSSYAVVPMNPIKNDKYRKVKKSSRRRKPTEEWIASEIPVPKIISEELFNKVRNQLELNSLLHNRNTKNEYLLAKKIRCECGRTRVGEGPQKGKHLYYRCTDRVCSFPLPKTCNSGSINARIADKMVWDAITELMTSPKLIESQIEKWQIKSTQKLNSPSTADFEALRIEEARLREQEDRYNKAYGAGLYTLSELSKYLKPIKEGQAFVQKQLNNADFKNKPESDIITINQNQVELFTSQALKMLKNLSFDLKRKVVLNVVDNIIATKEKLTVYGYIPITSTNVAFNSEHRNCGVAECGEVHII